MVIKATWGVPAREKYCFKGVRWRFLGIASMKLKLMLRLTRMAFRDASFIECETKCEFSPRFFTGDLHTITVTMTIFLPFTTSRHKAIATRATALQKHEFFI